MKAYNAQCGNGKIEFPGTVYTLPYWLARYYSIINLAKLADITLLNFFKDLINKETTSKNRREIASAIGRLRSYSAKDVLLWRLDSAFFLLKTKKKQFDLGMEKQIRAGGWKVLRYANGIYQVV